MGYDIENLKNPEKKYSGEVTTDRYGRKIPKHAHGTINLKQQTSSAKKIVTAVMELYDRIMDRELLIRRMYLAANKVVPEEMIQEKETFEQLDLFTDYAATGKAEAAGRGCAGAGNAKCRKPCWILRKNSGRMQF